MKTFLRNDSYRMTVTGRICGERIKHHCLAICLPRTTDLCAG